VLVARWRRTLKRGPKLVAVTIDHGLRPESAREARTVAGLARKLGVEHRTMRWTGRKPKTGIQEAARNARYRLLARAARDAGARHVLTAHTLDDQAETVLFRLARGSGVSGLAGMAMAAPLPVEEGKGILLVRPLLRTPKSQLIATLKAMKIPYANDPSNRDPRFTRPRFRAVMPALAREGLTVERLARLADRVERVEQVLLSAVAEARRRVDGSDQGPLSMKAAPFFELPEEIALRLLGQLIAQAGDEGPVELGKLEALCKALCEANHLVLGGRLARFRRTMAGAAVTLTAKRLVVERAPPRRSSAPKGP
jgi:tRNA(Ile)-lysidine synthase